MDSTVQIVIPMPTTLEELEAICRAARDEGFGGTALVMPPGFLTLSLRIVQPVKLAP